MPQDTVKSVAFLAFGFVLGCWLGNETRTANQVPASPQPVPRDIIYRAGKREQMLLPPVQNPDELIVI